MKITQSKTTRENTSCGKIQVTIITEGEKVKKIPLSLGKYGTCASVICGIGSQLTELALRYGASLKEIIAAWNNHHCRKPCKHKKGGTTYSCADAVAQVLKEWGDA